MKKRILSIMLTLCMVLLLVPTTVFAETTSDGNFEYSVSDGKVTITKYIGGADHVEIPSTIGGNPVTAIGANAFMGCRVLKTITIPDSVKSIGERAFQECGSLTSVTIPGSVTSIGEDAFYECTSLTSVNIPGSVTSIGKNAFRYCENLTSVTIPGSVTSIGDNTFNECTSLESINVDSSNSYYSSVDGVLFNKSITELIQYPVGNTRTSYSIPGSVTSIGEGAFRKCKKLTSVNIPGRVTSIGDNTFNGCESLTSVTIPGIVTSIGNYAFNGCTSLKSVNIPGSVTSIGDYTFNGCTSLKSVMISAGITSIGKQAFYKCTSLESVTIPESVTSIGDYAFYNCTNLKNIEIPDSVTSIGFKTFYACTNLESIFMPDGVTIGTDAIPAATSQVKYSLDTEGEVTITEITLKGGKTSVVIPAKICGYSVVAVADGLLGKISSHTCAGGEATCQSQATCGICGQKYGELGGHTYNWQSQDGKYWGECKICNDETGKKDIPTITINGADSVCVTQDYEFSFTLPENVTNATYGYEFENKGEGLLDPTIENGKMVAVISADIYETNEDSFKIIIDAKTEDGFEFSVSKTVALNKEHSIAKLPPEIINGKGQSIVAGEKKELTFRSNADFSDFIRVEIDGKTLDAKYYTAREGSTIITLKADYAASLSTGNHTIGIVSTSGTATTEFTVNVQAASGNGSPKTGDNSNLILWLALLFVSGGMMTVTGGYRKREKHS